MNILDYSAGYPGAQAVKAAGYGGVIRYLRKEGTSRVRPITTGEYDDMIGNGLSVAFVYQHVSKSRVTEGFEAGRHDANWALARALEVTRGQRLPAIYFAADYDAPSGDWPKIAQYMKGAADVLGRDRVGAYGKWALLSYLFDNNIITYGWQTYAWSPGHNTNPKLYHPQAALFQRLALANVGGVPCDVNEVLKSDFGQLPRPPSLPQQAEKTSSQEDDNVRTFYMQGVEDGKTFEHKGKQVKFSDLVFHVDATAQGMMRRHMHEQEWKAASDAGSKTTRVTYEFLNGIPGADGQPVKLFPWEQDTGGPLAGAETPK